MKSFKDLIVSMIKNNKCYSLFNGKLKLTAIQIIITVCLTCSLILGYVNNAFSCDIYLGGKLYSSWGNDFVTELENVTFGIDSEIIYAILGCLAIAAVIFCKKIKKIIVYIINGIFVGINVITVLLVLLGRGDVRTFAQDVFITTETSIYVSAVYIFLVSILSYILLFLNYKYDNKDTEITEEIHEKRDISKEIGNDEEKPIDIVAKVIETTNVKDSDEELRAKIKEILKEEKELEKNKKLEKIEVEVLKEKCDKKYIIITFIISVMMFLLTLLPSMNKFIYFIRNEIGNRLSVINMITNKLFYVEARIFILICSITLIAFFFSFINRKISRISKYMYALNTLLLGALSICFYYKLHKIGIVFYIFLVCNFILFIIPVKWNEYIEKKKVLVSKAKNYSAKNKKISEISSKKRLILITIMLILNILIVLCGTQKYIVQTNKELGTDVVRVVTEYVNIRKDSNTNSHIIGRVYNGEEFNVIEYVETKKYKCYKIQTEQGVIGYINSPHDDEYLVRINE